MTQDPMDEARRVLDENAPQAARIVLADYVGEKGLRLPDLILQALAELPSSGKIRRQKDIRAIKAISWLIADIPASVPEKGRIDTLFDDAVNRL